MWDAGENVLENEMVYSRVCGDVDLEDGWIEERNEEKGKGEQTRAWTGNVCSHSS
jgi:hypothetical protein